MTPEPRTREELEAEARRPPDPEFLARIEKNIERFRELLDRLAET
jgi:hypothetical protein